MGRGGVGGGGGAEGMLIWKLRGVGFRVYGSIAIYIPLGRLRVLR